MSNPRPQNPDPDLQVVQQLEELLLVGERLLARLPRRQQRAGLPAQLLDLDTQGLVGLQGRGEGMR